MTFICVFRVCVYTGMSQHACGCQRTISGRLFSLTMWVLEIKHRPSDLAARAFTHWPSHKTPCSGVLWTLAWFELLWWFPCGNMDCELLGRNPQRWAIFILLHQDYMLAIQFVTHFIVFFRLLHHRVTDIPFPPCLVSRLFYERQSQHAACSPVGSYIHSAPWKCSVCVNYLEFNTRDLFLLPLLWIRLVICLYQCEHLDIYFSTFWTFKNLIYYCMWGGAFKGQLYGVASLLPP